MRRQDPPTTRQSADARRVMWPTLQQISTAAGVAEYQVTGNGPPVIFLHGLDGSVRWWQPAITALAPNFCCYALNFLHFDFWRERSRVPLAAASHFVAAWLAALQLTQVPIVAHSLGGYVACRLVLEHPDLVTRLVLIAPAIVNQRPPYLRELSRLGARAWTVPPNFVPVLLGDSLRTGPLRWLRAVLELRQAPPLPLQQITVPTLLLWGTADPLIPASFAPAVASQFPHAQLVLLQGAKHVPMYEQPAACAAAIQHFLGTPGIASG